VERVHGKKRKKRSARPGPYPLLPPPPTMWRRRRGKRGNTPTKKKREKDPYEPIPSVASNFMRQVEPARKKEKKKRREYHTQKGNYKEREGKCPSETNISPPPSWTAGVGGRKQEERLRKKERLRVPFDWWRKRIEWY